MKVVKRKRKERKPEETAKNIRIKFVDIGKQMPSEKYTSKPHISV